MMIDIAKQFNSYPSGRVPEDGTFNGTTFRDDLLLPALLAARDSGERVVVDIDGVRTFGSSFLEEAFGGLIRKGGLARQDLERLLEIKCTKPHLELYKQAIQEYLDDAEAAVG